MVKILVTLVVYLVSFIAHSQTNNSENLNFANDTELKIMVEIKKMVSDKGTVYFGLYDSQDNFANRNPLKVSKSTIENGKVHILFDHLKPGIYAITCYHDANDNGKLDFAANGVPVEDYGATNNVMNYGPPRFEDAKFELKDKDLTFEIKF